MKKIINLIFLGSAFFVINAMEEREVSKKVESSYWDTLPIEIRNIIEADRKKIVRQIVDSITKNPELVESKELRNQTTRRLKIQKAILGKIDEIKQIALKNDEYKTIVNSQEFADDLFEQLKINGFFFINAVFRLRTPAAIIWLKNNVEKSLLNSELLKAILSANVKLVEFLISAGADANTRNSNGITVLTYAKELENFTFDKSKKDDYKAIIAILEKAINLRK